MDSLVYADAQVEVPLVLVGAQMLAYLADGQEVDESYLHVCVYTFVHIYI